MRYEDVEGCLGDYPNDPQLYRREADPLEKRPTRAETDADERESGLNTARFQRRDAAGEFAQDLCRDGSPVDEIARRHQSSTWIRWIVMIGVFLQRSSRPSSPVTTMRSPL